MLACLFTVVLKQNLYYHFSNRINQTLIYTHIDTEKLNITKKSNTCLAKYMITLKHTHHSCLYVFIVQKRKYIDEKK